MSPCLPLVLHLGVRFRTMKPHFACFVQTSPRGLKSSWDFFPSRWTTFTWDPAIVGESSFCLLGHTTWLDFGHWRLIWAPLYVEYSYGLKCECILAPHLWHSLGFIFLPEIFLNVKYPTCEGWSGFHVHWYKVIWVQQGSAPWASTQKCVGSVALKPNVF